MITAIEDRREGIIEVCIFYSVNLSTFNLGRKSENLGTLCHQLSEFREICYKGSLRESEYRLKQVEFTYNNLVDVRMSR